MYFILILITTSEVYVMIFFIKCKTNKKLRHRLNKLQRPPSWKVTQLRFDPRLYSSRVQALLYYIMPHLKESVELFEAQLR